jgi:FkbM family methyltransferase
MIMNKIFRSIQVYFPFLQDLKYQIRFRKMKLLKKVHDNDFNLMKWFQPNPGQVFVDIGSNRGEAITSMLIHNKSDTKIIGFEPNFETFKKLENYVSKERNLMIHNLGLGASNSSAILYTPFYCKWMFGGLASFKYENAKEWLKTRMFFYREKYLSVNESQCKIEMLDNFGLSPYFIKIDVQGLELEVLQGSKETLTKNTPIILIESINKECIEYLIPFGYNFYHFDKKVLKEGIGHPNTYCINLQKNQELKILLN